MISGAIAAVISGLSGRWFRPKNPPDDRDEVARELDELFGPYDFIDSGLAQAPPPPPQAPPPTWEEQLEELAVGTNTSAAELQIIGDGLMLIAGADDGPPKPPAPVAEWGG